MLNYKSNEEEIQYKTFYSKMNRIMDIGKRITSSLEQEDIINILKNEILKLNNAETVGIGLFNKKENNIEYTSYTKEKIEKCKIIPLNNNDFVSYCFTQKRKIFINYIEDSVYIKSQLLNDSDYRIESLICIPLLIKNNAIGIISMQSHKKDAYTIEDLKDMEMISGYASIALENGYLFGKVKYCAEHDDLTGMLKRNKILEQGKKISESITNEEETCSLIMIDIDYFKSVNDQYGHDIGDIVLKGISDIIKKSVRKSDFAGRYGGEEFLLILPGCDKDCSMKAAERIRKAVEQYRYKIHGNKFRSVTISLGIYQLNFNNNNFIDGLRKADKALYEAKNLGRNRSIIYEENI